MRHSLLAAALAVAGIVAPVVDAATVHVTQTLVPRQSNGRFDAAYPDGDDSSPVAWGTCPNIELTTATTQDYNLRTLCSLTGTNALTATLSKLSGTLPTGCIAGDDGIECTTPSAAGPNALVWRATDGTPADSNSFTITVTATLVPDVTDPTIPTGCSGVGGTGIVTITCDQSSDPYDSGAGSGVASYKIYLGGTLVATKTAPTPNIQQEIAGVTVGAADGSQSCTRTGANLAMSGGGAGLGSTADQFYGCGYALAGEFLATAKLTGFAGAVTTGTAGLMVRASSAAGSIYGTARGRDSDEKANNRYRTSTDGTASNATLTAAQSYPYWVKMLVSGGSVTAYTSTDGNTWAAAGAPVALSLGATPYVLAFHASGTAGTNSTSTLQQINIAPTTTWSQVVTTDVGGSFTVTAVDAAGNESDQGPAFVAAPSEPAGGGGECTGDPAPVLVHFDDFESATVDSGRWNTSNCGGSDAFSPTQDSCPTPSTLRARSGARALRSQITFHDGAGNWYHKRDNPIDQIAHRTELSIKAWSATGCPTGATCASSYSPANLNIGDEQWYGIATFHPGAGDANGEPTISVGLKNTQFINWQLHDTPDVGEVSRSPPLALNLKATPIVADLPSYPDTTGTTGSAQTSPPTVTPTYWNFWTLFDADAIQTANSYDGGRKFYPGEFTDDAGGWVDWVIRYKPNYTSAGILEIWKRRVGVDADFTKVVSYFGPNAPNDQTAPFLKMGIYSGGGNPAVPPADWPARAVVYHDSHRMALTTTNPASSVGTDNCAFQLVAPSGTAH